MIAGLNMNEHPLVLHSKPLIKRRSKKIISESFEGSIEELFQIYLHYRALYELVRDIAAEQDIEAMLARLLDRLNDLLKSERSLILLFDENGDVAYQKGRNLFKDDLQNPAFEASRKIIDETRKNNKNICLPNAFKDTNFQSKSVLRFKILSVICVPIRYHGVPIGILYLDNRHIQGIFNNEQSSVAEQCMDIVSPSLHHRLQEIQMQNQISALQNIDSSDSIFQDIIGHDPVLRKVLDLVRQVADSTATVLIEGASGTGKELVARAIHRLSGRRSKKFISLNCAALAETLLESELFGHVKGSFTGAIADKKGWFETADGGTIFFDEISEMSGALQGKLLRVLQTGEFSPVGGETVKKCDVRIVAATNKQLKDQIKKGHFRDDLYYRLNIITLELPLLKDRPRDILLLATHFLRKYEGKREKRIMLSSAAQNALQSYSFPGNIRELENAVRRALLLCNGAEITLEHLPPEMQQPIFSTKKPLGSFAAEKQRVVAEFERSYIVNALHEANGVVSRAAQIAQMDAKNFYQKMNKYGINAAQFKLKSKR